MPTVVLPFQYCTSDGGECETGGHCWSQGRGKKCKSGDKDCYCVVSIPFVYHNKVR